MTEREEIRKKAIRDQKVISCRPADLLQPEMEQIKAEYGEICRTEEDLLSCVLFPQVAPAFIRSKYDTDVHEIEVEWVNRR